MRHLWTAAAAAVSVVLVVVATTAALAFQDGDAHGHGSMMGTASTHSASVGTEYDYLAEMVAHHREAILAAGELVRSDRPQMRAFGASIIDGQGAQVEQMTRWITTWYQGRPTAAADYEPHMRDLSTLSGDQLDQAFLADMIGHHMVAVMMSQRLLAAGTAEHAEVTTLARDISSEQHAEIGQMTRWSRSWFGESSWGSMGGPMMGW